MSTRSVGAAGKAVFRQVRAERWADVRRNALLLGALSTLMIAVGGAVVWWAYRQGATHVAAFFGGVFFAMWFGMFAFLFTITGSHFRRMGGTAEQWTSKVFRKLGGRGWQVFDAVPFDGTNVDHVVIGPNHVLAVETKWTSRTFKARDNGHLQGLPPWWVPQAKRSARLVAQLLVDDDLEFDVTPVLVVWGPGVPRTERGWHKVGDVRVLIGAQSRLWKPFLGRGAWSSQATHRAVGVVQRHVAQAQST